MAKTTQGAKAMQAWFAYGAAYSRMLLDANEVILRRTQRMATGAMTGPEATAMVLEKATAMTASAQKAAVTAAQGGNPLRIAASALKPYGSKTRSNARRLRK